MLPAAARLRAREDFATTVRRGRRAARGPLVVHHLPAPAPSTALPQVGFVVARSVSRSAVVRNRVRRRLREVWRARLSLLAPGDLVVVRALPEAAAADTATLAQATDACLARLLAPAPVAP